MARRRAKKSYKRRHKARRVRRNPARGRRRGRRLRRNPKKGAKAAVDPILSVPTIAAGTPQAKKSRARPRRFTKAQRKRRKKLFSRASRIYKSWKGKPKSRRKTAALAQARRMRALAIVAPRKMSKSPLAKSLHLKSNPSNVLGLVKLLAPQVGAGAGALVGCAFAGSFIGGKLQEQPSLAGKKITPYLPAISTAGVAVGGYLIANRVAPRLKGAIVIGGLLGAVVQAIAVAAAVNPGGSAGKVLAAFGVGGGAPAPVATGEYTRVGGRAYAEGGMFREIGEYTLVGGAYSTGRPRAGLRDNAMEMALDGLDDATEFAPGEGGVLSGGMFRG